MFAKPREACPYPPAPPGPRLVDKNAIAKAHYVGVLETMKQLVAEIEGGEISVDSFYLIVLEDKYLNPNGGITEQRPRGYDSGLTIAEALYLLESEKFRILCMGHGIALPR